MKLLGIGASSGIAIAKVLKIVDEKPQINEQKVNDLEAEITKLNEAITKTIVEIQKIHKDAQKKLQNDESSIFEAHLQIAQDPSFQNDVIELIKQKKVTALYSVNEISEKYIALFEKMDNQYMRERVSDIKDVARRIINNLANIKSVDLSKLDHQVIIVSHDITPSQTAQMNKQFVLGFATNVGGKTSHAAIMARSLEIPAVVGLEAIDQNVKNEDEIIIDGDQGIVILKPTEEEKKTYSEKTLQLEEFKKESEKYRHQVSQSQDGFKVELAANIGSPQDVDNVLKNDGEAIGLFRSEFLYMDKSNWPSEDEQYHAYKQVLEKMQQKLVVIRTLDIGGDKKLKYFDFPEEDNPFLGYRAIRLCLDQVDIFKTQLRALIRASAHGNLAIMFPMIATVDELLQAKAIYQEVYDSLQNQHVEISDKIQIGMMIEVPSSAILTPQLAQHVDFFSIGTNDLMQYTMAHDRMNEKVSYLYQPLNPAMLWLINHVIKSAHQQNKWVGMCGEMASDEKAIPFLLGMGLNEFSMSAQAILKVRQKIAHLKVKDTQKLVAQALKLSTSKEVEKLLKKFSKQQ